jgi:hypothetical protein
MADHPKATVKFADCDFKPLSPIAQPPFASPTQINGRIEQFVDVLPLGQGGLPMQTTPAWAAAQMAAMLDKMAAQQRAGDGLTDFFQHWAQISDGALGSLEGWHPFTNNWAYFSELGDFTLADLVAGATTEPHRVGIFTDPAFLTQKPVASARGAALQAALLCVMVPPPPPNTPPLPPPAPGVSYRQRLESSLSSAVCQSCHALTDPPGFSLEHFDSLGQYRDLDNGAPVDSSDSFSTSGGGSYEFSSIEQELAVDLSQRCEVARCFAQSELEFALRINGMLPNNESLPQGSPEGNRVAQAFADSGRSTRALAQAIAQSALFLN